MTARQLFSERELAAIYLREGYAGRTTTLYHGSLTANDQPHDMESALVLFKSLLKEGDYVRAVSMIDGVLMGLPVSERMFLLGFVWADVAAALEHIGDLRRAFAIRHAAAQAISLAPEQTRWSGQPLGGKTIAVAFVVGGLGDHIMYARFLAPLAEQGARVIVQCGEPLRELFKTHASAAEVVGFGDPVEADYAALAHELPFILGTDWATLPPACCFNVEPAPIETTGRAVGVAWGCSWIIEDMNRSAALADFWPLSEVPGVQLFSLQRGWAAAQLHRPPEGMSVTDLGAGFRNLKDTAAAIMRMDLVVSTDSVIANLTGALGRPVYVLHPKGGDPRWMTGAAHPTWYPSAAVFQQTRTGSWGDAIENVVNKIRGQALLTT